MDQTILLQQLGILSASDNVAIVSELYDNFSEGNMPDVLAAMDEEIVWQEAEGNPLADGNPYVGPEAVLKGVFSRIGADNEYFKLTDVKLHAMDGNQVLATLRYDSKTRTGRIGNVQAAHLWSLREGKIIAFQQYADTRQLATLAQ
ncbi:ketosteroid isomerase [Lewinellaceae bacterium SD302]|nr:ketosteroid isomerase [Lewinellaceae bacterium SD302]